MLYREHTPIENIIEQLHAEVNVLRRMSTGAQTALYLSRLRRQLLVVSVSLEEAKEVVNGRLECAVGVNIHKEMNNGIEA